MSFLHLLGAWDGQWPRYAAMVNIELYNATNGTGAFVRLLYNGEPLTHLVPGCSADAGALCPYSAFRARIMEAASATNANEL